MGTLNSGEDCDNGGWKEQYILKSFFFSLSFMFFFFKA